MKNKKIYHKLVRDRIPDIIDGAGKSFSVVQHKSEALKGYAMKKLEEEMQEFIENPCAEEAGDVLEILYFICHRMGIYDKAVEAARTAKYVNRGGFEMGYVLEWVEE